MWPTYWLSKVIAKLGDPGGSALKILVSAPIGNKKLWQQDKPPSLFKGLSQPWCCPPPLYSVCVWESKSTESRSFLFSFVSLKDKHTPHSEVLSFPKLDKPGLHSLLILFGKQKVKWDTLVPGSLPVSVMKAKVTQRHKGEHRLAQQREGMQTWEMFASFNIYVNNKG